MFPKQSNLIADVYLWTTLPTAIYLFIFSSFVLRARSPNADVVALKGQHSYYFLFVSYVSLPAVALKQFQVRPPLVFASFIYSFKLIAPRISQALDCIAIANGEYLRIDTSVDCRSTVYQTFRVVDAFFIAVYMTLPLTWLVALWRLRSHLVPEAISQDAGLVAWMRDRDPELSPVRFLFSPYRLHLYGWETVEMYRRVAFVGVLPLLSSKGDRRAAIGVLFAIISLAVYSEIDPYELSSNRMLVRVSQYTVILTYGCGTACLVLCIYNKIV